MSAKDRPLTILLDQETAEQLEELAKFHKASKAQVIRACIGWRHQMERKAYPVCANGRACFVPAMHVVQGTQALIATTEPEVKNGQTQKG